MLRQLPWTNGIAATNGGFVENLNPVGQPLLITNQFASFGYLPQPMSINGPGWFTIRDPKSGQQFITRRWDFRLDSNNYLITSKGMRVQGFNTPDTTPNGPRGDIQIGANFTPATTDPAATMTTFRVQANGDVQVGMSDGTEYVRAKILLLQIGRPENIQRIDQDMSLAEADAEPAASLQPPGTAGLGFLVPGVLPSEKLPPLLTMLPRLGKPKITDEGVIFMTYQGTDLAIKGPGAFIVRDPATSELFATRAGMFLFDRDGYITTYDGKRLQGLNPYSHSGVGDIQIGMVAPATTSPTAVMTTFSIYMNGDLTILFTDGTEFTEAQILLYNFRQPELLTPARLGQFSGVAAAQPYAVEGVGFYGRGRTRIQSCNLELVNITCDLLHARQSLSFFTQGALSRSTNPTHLAIDGVGFFLLKHPLSGETFVTRRGDFHVDPSGYLVNPQSLRVQGISDVALNQIGDVRVGLETFAIARNGSIHRFFNDGTLQLQGYVLLQIFKESYQLRPVGHGLYKNLDAAAPIGPVFAGTYGAGSIEPSAVELPIEREKLSLPDRHGTRMLITGEPGSRWTIQAKDGRSKWKTIGVINDAPFELEFVDRTPRQNRNRVYRVLAEYPEP